jgi:Domain of unknown function (DUF4173)
MMCRNRRVLVQPENLQAVPQATPNLQVNPKRYAPEKPLQALFLLLTCVGLGIVADTLFRANFLGLNISLFVTALVVSLYVWSRRTQTFTLSPLLLGSLLLLTWMFSWRASLFLQFLNLAAQFFLLLLIAGRVSQRLLQNTNFAEMLFNFFQTGLSLIISPFAFLFQSPWQELNKFKTKGSAGVLSAVARGLLFAMPLLVVFAFLMSAADATFEKLLNNIFSVNLESTFNHLFVIMVVSFILLAGFAQTLFGTPWKEINVKTPKFLSLGVIETAVVFGSLVLLFSSFIAVQVGYLFGGETRVLTSDVTFAQYGRRGFFELVTVTVLLHIVLLFGLWFTENKAKHLYRWLATTLVVLLYGIIWSAFSRLNLYINTYGLTELRYYSSAATLWIGVVMLYFLFRLHSRKVPKLAPSYILLGVAGIVALYVSNPDARIAGFNLEQAQTSIEVDVDYLSHLSQDAIPIIIEFVTQQPTTLETRLLQNLLDNTTIYPTSDWRSFNLSRWQATHQLVEFHAGN